MSNGNNLEDVIHEIVVEELVRSRVRKSLREMRGEDVECNADLDHPCDADDGEPCRGCKDEHEYWEKQYKRSSPLERMTDDEYERDMIDAGRGHLLGK